MQFLERFDLQQIEYASILRAPAASLRQRPLDSLGADAVVSGLAEAGLEIARLMGDDRMGDRTSKLRRD